MSHAHLSAAPFEVVVATTVDVLIANLIGYISAVVHLTNLPWSKGIPVNSIAYHLWLSLLLHHIYNSGSGLGCHLLRLHLQRMHLPWHWLTHRHLLLRVITLHHWLLLRHPRFLLILHLHSWWLLLHHTWLLHHWLLLHTWLHLHVWIHWLLHSWLHDGLHLHIWIHCHSWLLLHWHTWLLHAWLLLHSIGIRRIITVLNHFLLVLLLQ